MAIDALSPSFSVPPRAIKSESLAGLSKDHQKARDTAEEFEQTFLTTMLSSMFEGVETSAPFGGGHAEQQFRSVLLGEYAKDMAKTGGIGIADEVYKEILAIQEGKV
jgi:peptidoglycan hydrolase FlgJ